MCTLLSDSTNDLLSRLARLVECAWYRGGSHLWLGCGLEDDRQRQALQARQIEHEARSTLGHDRALDPCLCCGSRVSDPNARARADAITLEYHARHVNIKSIQAGGSHGVEDLSCLYLLGWILGTSQVQRLFFYFIWVISQAHHFIVCFLAI